MLWRPELNKTLRSVGMWAFSACRDKSHVAAGACKVPLKSAVRGVVVEYTKTCDIPWWRSFVNSVLVSVSVIAPE